MVPITPLRFEQLIAAQQSNCAEQAELPDLNYSMSKIGFDRIHTGVNQLA